MEGLLNNFDPNSVKPIRDIVYETLRTAILQGEIKSGQRIVEKEYAEKFRISRTPVREALRKLETEGFVQYIPRKGVVVRAFETGDIIEIYKIRVALESMAIASAIENITETQTLQLREVLDRMEKAGRQGDAAELTQMCRLFNGIIMDASRMPRLTGLINTLQDYLEKFRKISLSGEKRRNAAITEHKAILQAILDKDSEKARRCVHDHLEGAKKALLENLGIKQTNIIKADC